jgi:hypothetical protein
MISSLENMDSFSSFIYLKKNIHDEKYHGRQTIKRFGKCLVGINQWETSGFFFSLHSAAAAAAGDATGK